MKVDRPKGFGKISAEEIDYVLHGIVDLEEC